MGAIDADAHVIETVQTWSYLEDDERRFTPQLMTQTFGEKLLSNEGIAVPEFWVIENRAFGKDRNVGTDTSKQSREMLSVQARLAHMDELGIETQVLYPTLFLRPVLQDAERERALCKSYNRWMGDLWRQGRGRLRWVAKPSLRLLEKRPAVVRDELEWAKKNGACGIFMRGLECERALGAAYFYPLWEMSADLDLPVCIHSATAAFSIMTSSPTTRRLQNLSDCSRRVSYIARERDSEKISKSPLGFCRGQRAMGALRSKRPSRPLPASGQVVS